MLAIEWWCVGGRAAGGRLVVGRPEERKGGAFRRKLGVRVQDREKRASAGLCPMRCYRDSWCGIVFSVINEFGVKWACHTNG